MSTPIDNKKELKHKFCTFAKLQLKEQKEDFHVSGFVATSHPDRAASEGFEGDIIPKGTLQKIVTDINNKYKPNAGAISERHDHIRADNIDLPVAGVLAPGTSATLQQLDDGEWGVHVDTVLSKTNPRYEEVKTNIEQGVYPGFSIEYDNTEFVPTEKEGKMYRMLTSLDTEGFGYAHIRKIGNPHAEYTDYGFKEIGEVTKMGTEIKALDNIQKKKAEEEAKKKKLKKGDKMEKKKELENQAKEILKEMEGKEAKEIEEKMKEALIPETIYKELLPKSEPQDPPANAGAEIKEHSVSAEDYDLLKSFKESKEKEGKVKEITDSKEFKEALSAQIKEVRSKSAPRFNTDNEGKKEFKEFDAFTKSLSMKEVDESKGKEGFRYSQQKEDTQKLTIADQYKEAGRMADSFLERGVNIWQNWLNRGYGTYKEDIPDLVAFPRKNAGVHSAMKEVNGRIEMKEFHRLSNVEMKAGEGLQTDTNLADSSWTYGSYFLSPVELNDIFQPILVNQLNDQTTTWGRLQKEDWSGRSQIQFRARTGRNSTAGGYTEGTNLTYGTDFTGNVGRSKFQQPFAYYRVLVAVTGQVQRLGMAPGGIGDVWANEIKWSGEDLLSRKGTAGTASTGLNRAVIGTGAGTQEDIALGFEGLILGTAGTLYGKTLGTVATATLHSHREDMSSEPVTLDQLRKMIRLASVGDGSGTTEVHSNSRVGDLVFITHHLQRDFVKALIQDMQRTTPTSGRIGFEGEIEFDGVPVIGDRQMETDDIFLINTANTKIALNLPPTLEPLPVTADAQAAHIKTYWNLYSDAPGNNYHAFNFATS